MGTPGESQQRRVTRLLDNREMQVLMVGPTRTMPALQPLHLWDQVSAAPIVLFAKRQQVADRGRSPNQLSTRVLCCKAWTCLLNARSQYRRGEAPRGAPPRLKILNRG